MCGTTPRDVQRRVSIARIVEVDAREALLRKGDATATVHGGGTHKERC